MFREALKRYAAIDIRPREGDGLRYDFFVRRHKFATLYMEVQTSTSGCVATYRTRSKELVLRRREDGFLYVEIEGHRALKFVPRPDGARGACHLAGACYEFTSEDTADGPRLIARRDGKTYGLGFQAMTAAGARTVAVGNSMIESADLHPLLAAMAFHAITLV